MVTKVWNKRDKNVPKNAVYIGRGSMWGNPFVIGKDGSRDDVCDKYAEYLENQVNSNRVTLQQLVSLHGKDLVCFCAPLRCHGDVLVLAAAWADEQLNKSVE